MKNLDQKLQEIIKKDVQEHMQGDITDVYDLFEEDYEYTEIELEELNKTISKDLTEIAIYHFDPNNMLDSNEEVNDYRDGNYSSLAEKMYFDAYFVYVYRHLYAFAKIKQSI